MFGGLIKRNLFTFFKRSVNPDTSSCIADSPSFFVWNEKNWTNTAGWPKMYFADGIQLAVIDKL